MITPQTKLSSIKACALSGNWKKAIAIASKFTDLGEERALILDAHTAFTNPRWTLAIKRNPDEDIRLGIAALCSRYGIEAAV